MARGENKLMKLKSSVLKKWYSFSRSNKTRLRSTSSDEDSSASSRDLQEVYVGKSRRRYLINSNMADHPVFQELAERESDDTINVACEVVMFEHLLWMLENSEPQSESVDEFVHFYSC